MKSHFILLTLFLIAVSTKAFAAVSDGTEISQANLAPLAAWVEDATHVKMSFLPVAIASDHKLGRALQLEDTQRAGAMGAYMPGRLIVSSTMWDPASLTAQSYIVHELVHHAQFISGQSYVCNAAKEREAYMLQSRWLEEHKLKPLVTQAWIDKMSSCASNSTTQNATSH